MCCKKSMMEHAVITPAREPCRPKSSEQGTIGHHPRRLRRICEEMLEVSRVRSPTPLKTRRAPQHDIALTVCHIGNGHHRSFLARQRSNKAPTGCSGLFHNVDRGRASNVYISQKCPKLCLEEYYVSIQLVEHNHVR